MLKHFGIVLGSIIAIAPCFYPRGAIGASNLLPLSSQACEKISPSESLSSARIRAADAASFRAVDSLPQVEAYRRRLEAQDFNTKVYNLADNYLQDFQLSTLSQTSDKICVTISAQLNSARIGEVFAQANQRPTIPDSLNDDEFNIELPPKPSITINSDIAYQEAMPSAAAKEPSALSSSAATSPTEVSPAHNDSVSAAPLTTLLVERTEFYDGNSTNQFFTYLQKDLAQIKGLKVVDTAASPDYILKTKVLKAQVDSLNAQTSRMHMVVSLTLTDAKTLKSITEHQNRFILFEAKDDAQRTAFSLTRKLFTAGINKLTPHIKTADSHSSVLTPVKQNQ